MVDELVGIGTGFISAVLLKAISEFSPVNFAARVESDLNNNYCNR